MLEHFCLDRLIKTRKTFIPKKASIDNWEIVSELMQGWKKGRSGGKIEPKKKRAEVEIYKILA